jgi:Flp pilus assembly protein TadB
MSTVSLPHMGLSQRLRDLDNRPGQKSPTERGTAAWAAVMLLVAVLFLVAEAVIGGPYGIAIFALAMGGAMSAGRVTEARARRRGRGLRE